MGVVRQAVATVTLVLVVFVLTFLVISHIRLRPRSGFASFSRRRGQEIRTTPVMLVAHRQAVDKSLVRQTHPGVLKPKNKSRLDAKEPTRRGRFRSSTASLTFTGVLTTTTIATTTTSATKTTVGDKRRSTVAMQKHRASNISSRMYFQSQDRKRKSNETRMFKRLLKRPERLTLLKMFGAVTRALRTKNVTFWIDAGTLLGSYRHHNLIPWDDDVDLILSRLQKRKVQRAIKSLASNYRLHISNSSTSGWRVSARNNIIKTARKQSLFPTIDLLFYSQNTTHVWLEQYNLRQYVWPRSIVFPLRLRPFDRFWVPAPCNTSAYLIREYRDPQVINKCVFNETLHPEMAERRQIAVPCRTLRNVAVVERRRSDNGSVIESLVRGTKVVHQYQIQQKC